MFVRLMTARRFAPLFWCQFISAFNDQFVKNVLVIIILFSLGGSYAGALVTLANASLVVPIFLFSGIAGALADRYDKAFVARRVKAFEIPVAALAAAGSYWQSIPILFAAVFGVGALAALFGPIKYGILPDHLRQEELPTGNGLVEGGTFLAILTGTIAGALAASGQEPWPVPVAILGMGLACWAVSTLIPDTGEADPDLKVDLHIVRSTRAVVTGLTAERRLLHGALTVSWFWLFGVVTLSLTPTLAKQTFGGDEGLVTFFLVLFSVAVAFGSMLASWIAGGRLILLPTPIAALLIGAFGIDLYFTSAGWEPLPGGTMDISDFLGTSAGIRVAIDLFGMAASAGLYVVPIFAAMQAWAGVERRARMVAGVNVINALFMTAATVVTAVLQTLGFTAPALFLLLAVLTIVAGLAILRAFAGQLRGDIADSPAGIG